MRRINRLVVLRPSRATKGAGDLPCREYAHGGRYRVNVRAARGIDELVRRLELGHESHAVRSAHADRGVPSALSK